MPSSAVADQTFEMNSAALPPLLDAAPDGACAVDRDGRCVYANPAAQALLDHPDLLGRDFHDTVHARRPDGSPYPSSACPILQGRPCRVDDEVFWRRDGRPIAVDYTCVPYDEGVVVLFRERRFEEVRERLAAIIDSANDAIVSKTLEGVITSWNAAAERIFGYTALEAIGRPITMLFPPDRLAEEEYILSRIRAGLRVESYETVRRTKDGRHIDISVTISPVRDARGRIVGASKIARDITDTKRRESELRHAKEAAEAAFRELESFSYSVSHDLRAPLRAINGFSLAVLEDYAERLDDTGRDYLRRMHAATQRMSDLIDALLQLSRVARVDFVREPVDLAMLARSIARSLQDREPAREVEFRIVPNAPVHGDARLLRVLMENLFGNAWKFTAKTPGALIEFGIAPGPVYFVRDNGAGFDPAYLDKLFVPFQRLHDAREYPGTGIGLATVQRIVMRHGGRIRAEGRPQGGATFSFTLPEVP